MSQCSDFATPRDHFMPPRHVTCICHPCGASTSDCYNTVSRLRTSTVNLRESNVLGLTIAQRLWLGLGLILALFAVADLVSLRAANRVDGALQTLVSGGDERRGAGYNMRSELAAMARAVQTYQNERDPRQRVRLNKAEKAFEQALTSY